MGPVVEPGEGVARNLAIVDERLKQIPASCPTAVAEAHVSLAQLHATCALVHAVRELTAEIRKARDGA